MKNDEFSVLFKHFQSRSSNSGEFDLTNVITGCLQEIQNKIPDIVDKDIVVPAIVASALSSVGAWHEGKTRDQILGSGYISILNRPHVPLHQLWRQVVRKKTVCFHEVTESKLEPQFRYAKKIEFVDDLQLYSPRDGPKDVWSASFDPLANRRLILSYVHDISQKGNEVWVGERRSVRLSKEEADKVAKPAFFGHEYSQDFMEVWHDGMKYPTPGGRRDSYGGVAPYMQPGAAVWHLVPRIRDTPGYPSTENSTYDRIIECFTNLRCGKTELRGLEDVNILPAEDKPFRDLSGVRRVWPMGEAVCGMLRDDLLLSIQDMAGVALTLMHYDKIATEMSCVLDNLNSESKIREKSKIPCFPRRTEIKWADLCAKGEGASIIVNQTLSDAGANPGDLESFVYAFLNFHSKKELLKFWYALLTARGEITDLQSLRHYVLEDLAVAPVFDPADRPKVYFMVEAAAMNRLERQIPYEESLRRFLRAGMRGELLLDAIDSRYVETRMEITRPQLEELMVRIWFAARRQPVWKQVASNNRHILRFLAFSWLSGTPGLCYAGRHTTSHAKELYITAAREWANRSVEDIVETATVGKKRMVVLLTDCHRMYRKIDEDSKTKIIVCSIFYVNEDDHNTALARFGNVHFHAEERRFRGPSMRRDTHGNPVDFKNSRTALCVVDMKGNAFELKYPKDVYQIVVTEKFGAKHGHLAAIRRTLQGNGREPVAVSWMDIMDHIRGEKGNQLMEMRPDQLSPDGNKLVDYSFEYDAFWADGNGTIRTTNTEEKSRCKEEVANTIASLREKDWW